VKRDTRILRGRVAGRWNGERRSGEWETLGMWESGNVDQLDKGSKRKVRERKRRTTLKNILVPSSIVQR